MSGTALAAGSRDLAPTRRWFLNETRSEEPPASAWPLTGVLILLMVFHVS